MVSKTSTKQPNKKISEAQEPPAPETKIPVPPPGQKRVREVTTKTEEYLADQSAPDDDADDILLREDDFDDAVIADEAEEELSPIDRFLQSLAGSTEAVVYVIRKPDPPTGRIKFRNPCSRQMTVGELPFDETFTDKEVVDLAVQSEFGGGYYMLQIRQGARVLKSWSSMIADTPAPPPLPPVLTPAVIEPAPPQPDPFETFLKQFERIEQVRTKLGLKEQASAAPAQPPVNPEYEGMKFLLTNSDFKENVLRKVLGGGDADEGEQDPWYVRLLLGIANNPAYTPFIIQAAQSALKGSQAAAKVLAGANNAPTVRVAANAGATSPRPPSQSNTAHAAPDAANNGAHPAEEEGDENAEADDYIIEILEPVIARLMLDELFDREAIGNELQQKVTEFYAEYPTQARTFLELITGDTEKLMNFIGGYTPTFAAAMRLPHAREWIDKFKAAMNA